MSKIINGKRLSLIIIVLGIAFWWTPVSDMLSRPSTETRQDCSFAKRILGNDAVEIEICHSNTDYRYRIVETAYDAVSRWRFEQHEERKAILYPTKDKAEFERVSFSEVPLFSWSERDEGEKNIFWLRDLSRIATLLTSTSSHKSVCFPLTLKI